MKKIKNILYSIASILFEHATLFAAIIASVYIITRGQLHKYETYELLLWIIGLLGLIAVASVSEKYFKLSKIEKSVEKIQAVVQRKGSGLDELAFTRKDLNPLEERLSDAKLLLLLEGRCIVCLTNNYDGIYGGLSFESHGLNAAMGMNVDENGFSLKWI